MKPLRREDGLMVQELSDETVVYDEQHHKAHCLNHTAALVWHHCDGQRSVTELARLLHEELGVPADEQLALPWPKAFAFRLALFVRVLLSHVVSRSRAGFRNAVRK